MKVYAVIERDRMGNERVMGLYGSADKAFEVAGLKSKLNWAINGTKRCVEVMQVQD